MRDVQQPVRYNAVDHLETAEIRSAAGQGTTVTLTIPADHFQTL